MPPKFSREIDQPVAFAESLRFQFRTSPCEAACPAGNPIQKMQALIEKGLFSEALRYIRAKNPFPGITGRVCPRFCQEHCNRSRLEDSVGIRALERAAADFAAGGTALFRPRPDSGKSVAIVGGGPAGLTAAYFLALLGHQATVYESGPVLGGVPRYAAPDFRLPRDIVDREVGRILELGVRARLNTRVGKDISFAELREHSDAVVVATGAPKENSLPIPNAANAIRAVAFLKSVALGQRPDVGKTVAVMGGGGVAFDCAFTARRLGAEQVHVFCLEPDGSLRAPQEDLDQAGEEGIHLHTECTLSAVCAEAGAVSGVEYYKVRECRFEPDGRLTVVPLDGGEGTLRCDTVIFAVGLRSELDFLEETPATLPELTPRRWIAVDERQHSSSKGLFAAGDVASGPASIAAAIGSGRRAAFGVHAYLTGESSRVFVFDADGVLRADDQLAGSSPPHVVTFEELYGVRQYDSVPAEEQARSNTLDFREISAGFSPGQAQREAARCMHCGHCKSCGTCVTDCPGYVLELRSAGGHEQPEVAFGEECWHCANCRTSCPCGAIGFAFPLRMQV